MAASLPSSEASTPSHHAQTPTRSPMHQPQFSPVHQPQPSPTFSPAHRPSYPSSTHSTPVHNHTTPTPPHTPAHLQRANTAEEFPPEPPQRFQKPRSFSTSSAGSSPRSRKNTDGECVLRVPDVSTVWELTGGVASVDCSAAVVQPTMWDMTPVCLDQSPVYIQLAVCMGSQQSTAYPALLPARALANAFLPCEVPL